MERAVDFNRLSQLLFFFIAGLVSHQALGFSAKRMAHRESLDKYSLQQKVGLPTTRTDANLGRTGMALSADGLTLIISAPFDDYDASGANFVNNAGAVYIYIKSAGTWVLQQKLVDPIDRAADDKFGSSVAISNDTVVVGAEADDTDASGANALTNSGAAFVFTRSGSTWSLQQKIVGTGTNGRISNDYFGISVAIDGNTIGVGAYTHDYDATGANYVNASGAVFVYTRSGSTWSLEQKLIASGTNGRVAEDRLGTSLAISGNTLVAGAVEQDTDASGASSVTDAGAAFVFTRSGTTWTLAQKLVAQGANGRDSGNKFGYFVAMTATTIVVAPQTHQYDAKGLNAIGGAGAVYVYVKSGSTWVFQQKLAGVGINGRAANNFFGWGLAIEGNMLAIGAPGQSTDASGGDSKNSAGAVYVFKRSNGAWRFQRKIVASGTNGRNANDSFGTTAALVGNALLVSAWAHTYDSAGANPISGAGAFYIFSNP